MDIAFSTIIIIILVIPGITFRRFYLTEPFSIKYIHRKLSDELIWAIVPSSLLHSIAIIVIESFTNFYFDFILLLKLITCELSKNELISIHENIGNILFYNISLWVISGLAGYYLKNLVRRNDWDLIYPILRFPNKWHYYFSGEYEAISAYEQQKSSPSSSNKKIHKNQLPDFIFIDALVNIENRGDAIYMGLLYDYELGPDGSLSHIILQFTERRYIQDDFMDNDDLNNPSNNKNPYYKIPGKYVLIPFERIKNLNFRYYNLEEISPKK